MKRTIESELIRWRKTPEHSPILLRGARQVGKTYIVERLGKTQFSNVVTINLEFQPQLKRCFDTLAPTEILNKLQLMLNIRFNQQTDLLFIDEIQECPSAIMSLRYFKEMMPNLYVIGAGSLLDFALRSSEFKMPVGRVQFLHIYPLSFREFLVAIGHDQLHEYCSEISSPVDETIHTQLLELFRLYILVGGMPASVNAYLGSHDLADCQHVQTSLLQAYRNDFGKYATYAQQKYLLRTFDAIPSLIGQQIKYSHIDPTSKSRDIKTAMELLTLAGLAYPIYATSASGIPLGAQVDFQRFKAQFLDTGLAQNVNGLQAAIQFKDFTLVNSGAIAEHVVGQELISCIDPCQPAKLYYWARNKPNSQAEIDFLFPLEDFAFPIEVKSGKTGTLKSLHLYLDEKKAPFGIKLSKDNLSYHQGVLSVPIYLVEQLPRLIRSQLMKMKKETA